MSYITDLRAELDSDPDTYSSLSNLEVAVLLNAATVGRNLSSLTGAQVWAITNSTEYNTLANAVKTQWLSLCGISEHDPFGPTGLLAENVFGNASATVLALQTLRVESISRATELGFQAVKEGHVEMARAI